jgi:hypothetical protein
MQFTNHITEESSGHVMGALVGRVVRIDEKGKILVNYHGNSSGALVARTTSSVHAALHRGNPAGREVLLIFENNDPQLPIIVDTMYSPIDELMEHSTNVLKADTQHEETLNGKRVITIAARDEIILRCGKSSITMTRAGKILIKGKYVLSSATGLNKIRGGSAHLN